MAKTIADLGEELERPKPVVGRSMISDSRESLEKRLADLMARRQEEMRILERGGYDYGGNEEWIKAMERVGRR